MLQDDGSSSVTSSSPIQIFPIMSLSPGFSSSNQWLKELKSEERGLYLIHLLLACANHVSCGSLENANIALDHISQLASPNGDTMQRIASHFTEALADRILRSWPGIYKALRSTKLSVVSEDILVRKMFFEFFPFLKVAFVVTNQAIIEAMEGEKMVHIVDLNAGEPLQWRALLQDLSARPEGPPHLRITGVHQQKEVLDQMAYVLTEEAEKLDIPFQFNQVVSQLEDLDVEKLRVKTGEALAISSVMQLHTLLGHDNEPQKKSPLPFKHSNGVNLHRALINQNTLGELLEKDMGHMANGYSPSNDTASSSPLCSTTKMDGFLNALWGLSPKVMVVTEQDSNHNGTTLMERLSESLHYYAALFDCLESALPRTSLERLKVEKMLLGEEIKNIIACEGLERKERHEKLEKWFQRFDVAGFGNAPLSYYAMLQARRLLQSYSCEGYKIKEENGCVVICWHDRALFSVSSWRCRK
ncbi:PREDICTED: scarecrow-like protein 3 [Nicotiana attenuata]|uniref:Scarecrow-like protein 3 n=1 Tax=Nicotiana attenuata TaxID=49451 RepID=A0A1J6JZ68_NICAT|nr:PREDICTED: scarecrow-like protein 3 [Nicotiana attenuata]OIT23058.1 scarecrow-like protein 3 [Nicotiana attenuata]